MFVIIHILFYYSVANFNQKLFGFFKTVEWTHLNYNCILVLKEITPKHVGDHNTIKVHQSD